MAGTQYPENEDESFAKIPKRSARIGRGRTIIWYQKCTKFYDTTDNYRPKAAFILLQGSSSVQYAAKYESNINVFKRNIIQFVGTIKFLYLIL